MLPRAGLITPEYFRDHILPKVVYQGAEFLCTPLGVTEAGIWTLLIRRPVTDTNNPGRTAMQLFNGMIYGGFESEEAAVKWVFDTIMKMEEHEAQEWFHYEGERIYDPHTLPSKRARPWRRT